MSRWEDNKVAYPELIGEEILNPANDLTMRLKDLSPTSNFEMLNSEGHSIDLRSFPNDAMLIIGNGSKGFNGNIEKMVMEDIKNNKIKKKFLGKTADETEDASLIRDFEWAFGYSESARKLGNIGVINRAYDRVAEETYRKIIQKTASNDTSLMLLGYKRVYGTIGKINALVVYREP